MTLEAIKAAIPHREPFLLLDEIVEQGENRIVCRKRFTGDEFWYTGHYPGFPLTPGVILCEAAMQAGGVLLAQFVGAGQVPVVTRLNDARFKRMVRPGDTVELEAEITDRVSKAIVLAAKVTVAGKLAARLSFVCTFAVVETDFPVGEPS
ncbi:MAG: 3-hydroxyacyl-ACP dehydratase FabZ family protein [Pirellulales bacterium]